MEVIKRRRKGDGKAWGAPFHEHREKLTYHLGSLVLRREREKQRRARERARRKKRKKKRERRRRRGESGWA